MFSHLITVPSNMVNKHTNDRIDKAKEPHINRLSHHTTLEKGESSIKNLRTSSTVVINLKQLFKAIPKSFLSRSPF